jgi:DNA-binding transcriptional LysR family regulator
LPTLGRPASPEAATSGWDLSGPLAAGAAREILAAFRSQHPGVGLHLTELGAAELLKRTLTREIDCPWIVPWHDLDPVLETEPLWSKALHLADR